CWLCFFFSSRRRHTRCYRDWSSDVCSSDLVPLQGADGAGVERRLVREPAEGGDELRPQLRLAGGDLLRRLQLLDRGLAGVEVLQIGRASCRERVWSSVVGGGGYVK